MSQNSVIIPTTGTLSGLAAIQDINAALDSLQSNFAGPTEPAVKQAYMDWPDTTSGLYKIRNAANTAWIAHGPLAMARFGSQDGSTVASAATPDIWTGTGDHINYIGTATATGFAAAPNAWAWRKLICAGACAFTAGANLIINGVASGNYTAAAGDVIFVFAITATQFRLVIQKADGTAVVATGVSTGCRAQHSANQSINNDTWTTVAFDGEEWDTNAYHDLVTNNSRITIPPGKAGKYLIGFTGYFADNATGVRGCKLVWTGAPNPIAGGLFAANPTVTAAFGYIHCATVFNFAAGEYIEVQVYQNSGGALNLGAGTNITPKFFCHFLGT